MDGLVDAPPQLFQKVIEEKTKTNSLFILTLY